MTSEQTKSTQSLETKAPEAPIWLRLWRSQQENIWLVAIALILAILIRLFVAEPRYIPSDSMLPTLHTGDRLLVEKVSYLFHPPQMGDIVVFEPPEKLQKQGYSKNQVFIKRVIGKPGDTVGVHKGKVYVNNKPLSEDYIAEPPAYELVSAPVPAAEFFVMGDNRNDSNDSHVWGFLPQQNIIGRAIFRFWPFNRVGIVSK
jgi:signal peptidase I